MYYPVFMGCICRGSEYTGRIATLTKYDHDDDDRVAAKFASHCHNELQKIM